MTLAALVLFCVGALAIGTDLSVRRLGIVSRVSSVPIHAAMLTGGYALFFVIAAIPLVIFSTEVFGEIQVSLYPIAPQLPYLTSIFILIFGAIYFVIWHIGPNHQYLANTGLAGLQSDRAAAQDKKVLSWKKVQQGVTILLTVGVSGVVLISLTLYWNQFGHQLFRPLLNWNLYPILDEPAISLLGIAILLPIAYFFAGFVYQVSTHLLIMAQLVRQSEFAHTIGENPSIEVRRLPTSFTRVNAVSILWYQFIGVPGEILDHRGTDVLPEDEYIALLEHEQAHLKNGDAKLSFLIKILSPLIFIGGNVIYALFDFRKRELVADSQVSNKRALHSLLQKALFNNGDDFIAGLDTSQKASESDEGTKPAVPQIRASLPGATGRSKRTSTLRQFFQPYFGDFALTAAHPSPLERMDKLEEQFSDQGSDMDD